MSRLSDLLNGDATEQKTIPAPQEKSNSLDSLFNKAKKVITENRPEISANILETELTITTDIGDWEGQELPPDAPELAKSLKESLTHLQEALQAGDIATALYDTKRFIDENPATKELLHPKDINLFIKALQSSHSIVIAKKSARKTKKSVNNEKAEALAAELTDLGL